MVFFILWFILGGARYGMGFLRACFADDGFLPVFDLQYTASYVLQRLYIYNFQFIRFFTELQHEINQLRNPHHESR
jgi:hypothetical protein